MSQRPRLLRSDLTGHIYVATRYNVLRPATETEPELVETLTKHDVTEDFYAALAGIEWWTTTEVADYLGVETATVSTYRARNQMPAPDFTVGRTHVWRPARIIDWRPQP